MCDSVSYFVLQYCLKNVKFKGMPGDSLHIIIPEKLCAKFRKVIGLFFFVYKIVFANSEQVILK